ncbi:unnamed protein product [Vitrella brassicaformis CCMP3155]|uniref:C2H2-type domain-containing protein n=2 Tax=Vitrella brassicaformis TaxID=1169539 RepID=A0A0G4EA43_VITBC|nr:unnamed protein product [Vitrella brassicaformis CCMP3155]|eukprot:CEL92106.1 unnamed protein product [Vitrella brassicaformis CCMP3155]
MSDPPPAAGTAESTAQDANKSREASPTVQEDRNRDAERRPIRRKDSRERERPGQRVAHIGRRRGGRGRGGRHPDGGDRSPSRSRSRSRSDSIYGRRRRFPPRDRRGPPPGVYDRDFDRRRRYIDDDIRYSPRKRRIDEGDMIYSTSFNEPLLSFRSFVINQDEGIEPMEAVERYDDYRTKYKTHHSEKFFKDNKDAGYLPDKYRPDLQKRQHDERSAHAKQNAQQFIKLVEENAFDDLSLTVQHTGGSSAAVGAGEGEDDAAHTGGGHLDPNLRKETSKEISGHCEAPFYMQDADVNTLFFSNVPLEISKWDCHDLLQGASGFGNVFLTEPLRSDLTRKGYARFDSDEAAATAEKTFKHTKLKDRYVLNIQRAVPKKKHKVRVAPADMAAPSRIQKDLQLSAQLIAKLDREWQVEGVFGDEGMGGDEGYGEGEGERQGTRNPLLKAMEANTYPEAFQLDLQILYLRRVHNVCYYSAECCENERELQARCGVAFLRQRYSHNQHDDGHGAMLNGSSVEESSPWVDTFDQKIQQLLNASHREPVVLREEEEPLASKWKAYCDENTMKVEEGRFRCNICRKLFKAAEFVHKHLRNKHESALQEIIDKLHESMMHEAYMGDSSRLVPLPHGAPKRLRLMHGRDRDFDRHDGPLPNGPPDFMGDFYPPDFDGPGGMMPPRGPPMPPRHPMRPPFMGPPPDGDFGPPLPPPMGHGPPPPGPPFPSPPLGPYGPPMHGPPPIRGGGMHRGPPRRPPMMGPPRGFPDERMDSPSGRSDRRGGGYKDRDAPPQAEVEAAGDFRATVTYDDL